MLASLRGCGIIRKIFIRMKIDLSHQYGFSAVQVTGSMPLSDESLDALKCLNSKIGDGGGEAGRPIDPLPELE